MCNHNVSLPRSYIAVKCEIISLSQLSLGLLSRWSNNHIPMLLMMTLRICLSQPHYRLKHQQVSFCIWMQGCNSIYVNRIIAKWNCCLLLVMLKLRFFIEHCLMYYNRSSENTNVCDDGATLILPASENICSRRNTNLILRKRVWRLLSNRISYNSDKKFKFSSNWKINKFIYLL